MRPSNPSEFGGACARLRAPRSLRPAYAASIATQRIPSFWELAGQSAKLFGVLTDQSINDLKREHVDEGDGWISH